eukprot:6202279-Pleurochrysis_carterae.AAC.2
MPSLPLNNDNAAECFQPSRTRDPKPNKGVGPILPKLPRGHGPDILLATSLRGRLKRAPQGRAQTELCSCRYPWPSWARSEVHGHSATSVGG